MSEVWSPTDADKGWLRNLVRSLNNGGVWVVPATGQVFMKRDDSLIWTNEHLGDDSNVFERTKTIGEEIGIEVYKESEL